MSIYGEGLYRRPDQSVVSCEERSIEQLRGGEWELRDTEGRPLTPVATPVNLIVMGPGGYRFGDYWKLGLPVLLWFFVVAVFLVPVFWSF